MTTADGAHRARDVDSLDPEDPPSYVEDDAEDGRTNPGDGAAIPRKRAYRLSPEGRKHLSGLGKSRWATASEAVRRESELSDLRECLQEELDQPAHLRLRSVVRQEVEELPEVAPDTVLRVSGHDYTIHEDGRLEHLYFPSGEKTEFQNGEWFQFGGRAYCVHDGRLEAVRASTILDHMLDREE